MIGTTLGRYRILARLGEGGMGEVYAAEDTKLRRRVALKVLPPEMAADPEHLQRFRREALVIAALDHPNIVTVYSVEEADGLQFVTMELVEGRALAEIIPPDGLPLDQLFKLSLPLLDAAAAVHHRGIILRGLRPAAILLTASGQIKVVDFGFAKPAVEAPGEALATALPMVAASPGFDLEAAAYWSPEQAAGRPADCRSDVFSLGALLYEMACGKRPFGGNTVPLLLSSIVNDTPRPLSEVKRNIPPLLDRAVAKALSKDPSRRQEDARELRRDVYEVEQRVATRGLVPALFRAAGQSPWMRRAAVGAVLLAVVSAAAWYLASHRAWLVRRSPAQAAPPAFTPLTSSPGIEQFPSLTPDGKRVVYAGQQSGNWDIYIQGISAQDAINLTADSPVEDNEPAVSRDGKRIAFRSSRDGGGIFVMGLAGERVRRVTPVGVSAAYNPTWSPDGTEIAYATEDVQLTPLNWEGRTGLWVVDERTGARRSLDVENGVQPSWSPHGHRIAYVARPRRAATEPQAGTSATKLLDLWTVPARGGKPVQATSSSAANWSPTWSSDGGYLYFVSDRAGTMNLWRVAIDEVTGEPLGEAEPVTTPAQYLAHPTVSADGRLIAYCAKLETGNIHKLAIDPTDATVAGEPTAVTRGSNAWANPDVTTDGEWIVASTREPDGDLYVMRSDGTGRRRQLTAEPEFVDRGPRWSPDKTWIAYFSTRQKDTEQWKIRFDGSERQRVAPYGGFPVWSPDGARLAASPRVPNKGEERITYLLDATRPFEAQTPEALPRPAEALRRFIVQDWSPDGTRLVGQLGFTASRGDGIVVYTFGTRRYERVAEFGEYPLWLPDSRRVLFVANGKEYWVVDTRTNSRRQIYSAPRGVLGPARLSRDGRVAVFPLRLTEADIYLMSFD
jgi:Tol biopolymer transport system component